MPDLDVVGVGEEHCESVDAHAPAASGRQTVFERRAEALVDGHRFVIASSLVLIESDRHRTFETKTAKYLTRSRD